MSTYDDRNLTYVVIGIIALSWCLIGIVFALDSISDATQAVAGWVAVAGAAIIFGGTGIPMKYKILKEVEVNPSVFSLYTGVGVFLITIPITIYLAVANQFHFVPYSILGATFISIIGYFAFIAVQNLGYARAPALWAAIGMITAYLWGLVYFQEPTSSVYLSSFAIVFLVIGVFFVSTSQASVDTQNVDSITVDPKLHEWSNPSECEIEVTSSMIEPEYDVGDLTGERKSNFGIDGGFRGELCEEKEATSNEYDNNTKGNIQIGSDSVDPHMHFSHSLRKYSSLVASSAISYLTISYGFTFCLLTGLLDGSLMLPFKLASTTTTSEILQYISSFSLSAGVVAPILFLAYTYILRPSNAPLRAIELHTAAFPGISSGALWGAGKLLLLLRPQVETSLKFCSIHICYLCSFVLANIMSVQATNYLGIKVGFPLTQTCILITAMWGIFYFKEFDLWNSPFAMRFCFGIVSILVGAYMLGSSYAS